MRDIIPFVAEIISGVCENIEIQFPPGRAEFPLITLISAGNATDVVLDGGERFSRVAVQVDIWDNSESRAKCEDISHEVSKLMISAGFLRTVSIAMEEDGLHRCTMTFTAQIDERHNMIYS